jgi:sugar phosphate isomerase/epimerase
MVEVCSFPSHLDYHDKEMVRDAAKAMKEMGMEPYSFHAPFAHNIDITSLNVDAREFAYKEMMLAAEAAAILEARHFVIHPGPEESYRPPAEEHLRRLANAAGVLNRLARRCQEMRVGVVLENMLPHLMFGRTTDMLWLMGALETVNVGACMDSGHAYLSGDVHHVMHKLSGHLRLVHGNDNRGKRDDHLAPGLGHIRWKELLAQLYRGGFRGAFILELAGGREPLEILHDARQSRAYLRNIGREMYLNSLASIIPEVED